MRIYTMGYCGRSPASILEFLEKVDGVAVDVRMVPRSYVARFNGSAFQKVFGARYLWVQDFGNINYKNGGPIAIADFDKGVKRLELLRTAGRVIVLMCGCPDVNVCHRKVLAQRLAEQWGAEVVHLPPPPKTAKPEPSGQTTLF